MGCLGYDCKDCCCYMKRCEGNEEEEGEDEI